MALYKRKYWNYKQYLKHQKSKLDEQLGYFSERIETRTKNFVELLRNVSPKIPGNKVLCLAARLGEEVRAFIELGHTESIGIDINPGPDNKYVIEADFHDIPFDKAEFDGVYCNCLDHAWDLKKIAAEVARVIKPEGIVVLEVPFAQNNPDKDYTKNVKKNNKFEAMVWDGLDDVLGEFSQFEEVYERVPSASHKITVFLKKK